MDQVPLPFVIDMNTTYESEEIGHYDKVWVATPGSGLEKRQCTLQICFSPEDNTCRVYIIFRGTKDGKYISQAEKNLYHPAVDILWQKNAWADGEVSLKWINTTLKNAVQDSEDEFLLLCDNLSCQTTDEFKKSVRDINGLVWYLLKGAYFKMFTKMGLLLLLGDSQ